MAHGDSCCSTRKKKVDYVFWVPLGLVALLYFGHMGSFFSVEPSVAHLSHATFELMNKMWWGLALGIVFVGVLSGVPREFVMSALGPKSGVTGVLRATAAGLLLDLCSHGILLVGMKLYERGASLGQTMAFLIASPWNSISLTLVLWALIGWQWTLCFVILSGVVAVLSGVLFDFLVGKQVLPENPNRKDLPLDFRFWTEARKSLSATSFDAKFFGNMLVMGLRDSKMILKWIFIGALMASVIQTFVPTDILQEYFGVGIAGLFMTLLAATVIEVCSEGSSPIAADLLTRAMAPGNSFLFLMAGVSTDYTEFMALRETTKSWKIALFLPLVTLPQILVLAYILNHFP